MESKQPDEVSSVIVGKSRDERTKHLVYRDVLFTIAWVNICQGGCFLATALLLNDVSILPDDPYTMIGTMFIGIGLALFLLSRVCGRNFFRNDTDIIENCRNESNDDVNECESDASKVIGSSELHITSQNDSASKRLSGSNDEHWDMIVGTEDVNQKKTSDSRQHEVSVKS